MDYLKLLAILDGNERNFGEGAIVGLVAILMVFMVLLVIILIASLVSAIINKVEMKKVTQTNKQEKETKTQTTSLKIDVNDEDMMAAILVATIDYRNEVKEDVKVVSVRR